MPVGSFFQHCTSEVTGFLMTSSGCGVGLLLYSTQSSYSPILPVHQPLQLLFLINTQELTKKKREANEEQFLTGIREAPWSNFQTTIFHVIKHMTDNFKNKMAHSCHRERKQLEQSKFLLAKSLVAGQTCPQCNRLTSVFVLLWIIGGPKLSW